MVINHIPHPPLATALTLPLIFDTYARYILTIEFVTSNLYLRSEPLASSNIANLTRTPHQP